MQAALAVGRDDYQPIDAAVEHACKLAIFVGRVVIRFANQQAIALGVGHFADATRDLGAERVGNIGQQQTQGLRRLLAQAASQRVPPIPKFLDGLKYALARFFADGRGMVNRV